MTTTDLIDKMRSEFNARRDELNALRERMHGRKMSRQAWRDIEGIYSEMEQLQRAGNLLRDAAELAEKALDRVEGSRSVRRFENLGKFKEYDDEDN